MFRRAGAKASWWRFSGTWFQGKMWRRKAIRERNGVASGRSMWQSRDKFSLRAKAWLYCESSRSVARTLLAPVSLRVLRRTRGGMLASLGRHFFLASLGRHFLLAALGNAFSLRSRKYSRCSFASLVRLTRSLRSLARSLCGLTCTSSSAAKAQLNPAVNVLFPTPPLPLSTKTLLLTPRILSLITGKSGSGPFGPSAHTA